MSVTCHFTPLIKLLRLSRCAIYDYTVLIQIISKKKQNKGVATDHNGSVAGLDLELRENPDAVGEFDGLVEHVLALHIPLGDGEDVGTLQLVGDSV